MLMYNTYYISNVFWFIYLQLDVSDIIFHEYHICVMIKSHAVTWNSTMSKTHCTHSISNNKHCVVYY